MVAHEKMEVFLREVLMEIEHNQVAIIRRLETSRRKVESLQREKVVIEEKLKDNISFFNPACAKNREKIVKVEEDIALEYANIDKINTELGMVNDKIQTMGNVIAFMKEHAPEKDHIEIEDNSIVENGVSILQAQEMERQRIARDLHDSTVQNLTNMIHKTEYCSLLIDKDPIQVKFELESMMECMRESIDEMRKIIYDLRPMSIDDLGLVPTIQRYVDKNKMEHGDIDFQIKVKSEIDEFDIPSVVTLTIFRILQETCNNIFKHSQAKKVEINIFYWEDEIEVQIKDDGIGFDVDEIGKEKEDKSRGFGLSIMKERAQLLNGTFTIKSQKEQGTNVTIVIPYEV